MAKLVPVKAESFCFLSHNRTALTSPLNHCNFRLRSSKHSLKFRVVCSIREKENVKDSEKGKVVPVVLTEVNADGLEKRGSSKDFEDQRELGFHWNWPPWKNIPQRYKIIGTTSLAFVVCNMDKVNLSIAIIPMSHQFGWNASTAGLVQSSFFWGYALSQLPGGWLAKIFGGRKVLEFGVLIWSVATAFLPFLAGYMPGLVLSRILVGIGEGVSPSAATDLIASSAQWALRANPVRDYAGWTIPLKERSRAVAFVFGGLSVGSVTGLLLAPPLIQNFGWESVFYLFGFLGVAWYLGFRLLEEEQSSEVAMPTSWSPSAHEGKLWNGSLAKLGGSLKIIMSGIRGFKVATAVSRRTFAWTRDETLSSSFLFSNLYGYSLCVLDVPWKAFFKSQAVWAMIYAHFCGSWGHYTCLSWLPSYFSEELNLNLTEAAWVSILPPMASVFVTTIASQCADSLIANGVETTTVRKICQTIGFMSPAICMVLSSVDVGLPPWEIVGILTGGLALSSFALSGLYCTHQDISPEYASILLGITNTVGAIPGIVGVALTGYLLDTTHSWSISLFAPSIFFYLTGTIVWLAFASSKPQNFSN